jgi:shikimate kinase
MMGAGKSSIGRALAERTDRQFIDTDLLIQQRLGRSISQIFQFYGEEAFRSHETSVLKSLVPGPSVVSTGGGVVTIPENWPILKALGPTIYLRAAPETLIARLVQSKKKRPLLDVEDWETQLRTLLATREPLYTQADFTIEVDEAELSDGAKQVENILAQAGIE